MNKPTAEQAFENIKHICRKVQGDADLHEAIQEYLAIIEAALKQ